MTNLKTQMKRKKKAQEFERSEIARIRQTSRSSFIEVYKVSCGDDTAYLASSSAEQAKIDYLMWKRYYDLDRHYRSEHGAVCRQKPSTSDIEARLVG